MITNISDQQKYHSFMLVRTESKQLAEKLQYYILSSNDQILMNSQQTKVGQKCEYNISIDTIAYQIPAMGSIKLILSQANWIKSCLQSAQSFQLSKLSILRYDSLQCSQHFRYFYYIGNANVNINSLKYTDINPINRYNQNSTNNHNIQLIRNTLQFSNQTNHFSPYGFVDQFVQVIPKYIHKNDCLIFEIYTPYLQSSINTISQSKQIVENIYKFILPFQSFKLLSRIQYQNNVNQKQQMSFVHFKSEYALLSDQHFLNCLVRGVKLIGSYIKIKKNYLFWINQQIYNKIKSLYPQSKL